MAGKLTPESYDLLLENPSHPEAPVGVMLVRAGRGPTVLDEVLEPTELGAVSPPRPVPVIWDTWRGGAGAARPVPGVSGAYRQARNACTRFGAVTPAGGLHELSLQGLSPLSLYKMVPYKDDIVISTGDNRPLLIKNGVGPVVLGATLNQYTSLQDPAVFGGALYFGGGAGGVVKYDGTTWTEAVGGQPVSRLAAVTWTRAGQPRRRLVATTAGGSAFIYTTGDDPLNPAHWSSPIPVESEWPIQQLISSARHVYAIGPGGVFDLTENGETPCITGDQWARNYNASNGATGVLYDGSLYVGSLFGTFAVPLDGTRVDVMEDVSIGHLQPAELPVGGQLSLLGTLDGWLTNLTWSHRAGGSQLWYGLRRERAGVEVPWPIVWYGSECDLVGQQIMAMVAVAPTGAARRMYFGTRDLTTNQYRLWWQALPRYGSPLQDWMFGADADRMDYARDWDITFTEERLADAAAMKDPLWWDVMGRNLGGANRLTLEAAPRDGPFELQGTATTNRNARFGASGVKDTGIVVRVTGANDDRVPAVLDAVKGSWVVTVEESATILLEVQYGRGVSLLNGSEDPQDADTTFGTLQRLTQFSSVSATRWNGDLLTVRIEQGIRRRWIESPQHDGWIESAVIPMTILSTPMRHDVGHQHDLLWRHDG